MPKKTNWGFPKGRVAQTLRKILYPDLILLGYPAGDGSIAILRSMPMGDAAVFDEPIQGASMALEVVRAIRHDLSADYRSRPRLKFR